MKKILAAMLAAALLLAPLAAMAGTGMGSGSVRQAGQIGSGAAKSKPAGKRGSAVEQGRIVLASLIGSTSIRSEDSDPR